MLRQVSATVLGILTSLLGAGGTGNFLYRFSDSIGRQGPLLARIIVGALIAIVVGCCVGAIAIGCGERKPAEPLTCGATIFAGGNTPAGGLALIKEGGSFFKNYTLPAIEDWGRHE